MEPQVKDRKPAWRGSVACAIVLMLLGWAVAASAEPIAQEWVAYQQDYMGMFDYGQIVMTVDDSGNAYLATLGEYDTGPEHWNYLTFKYDPDGTLDWTAQYNGSSDLGDEPHAIAVDGAGNVIVTGESYDTVLDEGYLTVKYNASGTEQWTARYDGDNDHSGCSRIDSAYAVDTDGDGNVYVTGSAYVYEESWMGCTQDAVTIKYDADGNEQWASIYHWPAYYNSTDAGWDIAVTDAGDVYVAGNSGAGYRDFLTIKYNTSGVEQWVARYDGPGGLDDSAAAIALDSSENVYVAGTSWGDAATRKDWATVKYNNLGVEQWVERFDGAGHPTLCNDEVWDLDADTGGNVYVTGSTYQSAGGYDMATISYDTNGNMLWSAFLNGDDDGYDWGAAVVHDGSGGAFVTGKVRDAYVDGSYITIHYDNAGDEIWIATRRELLDGDAWAAAVGVGSDGDPVITGVSCQDSGCDYTTVKYSRPCFVTATVVGSAQGWGDYEWVHTRASYGAGDTVDVTASGLVYLEAFDQWVGPEGLAGQACGLGCAMPSENLGALVGMVGSEKDSGPIFLVGSSYSAPAAQAGDLWLGINENYYLGVGGSFLGHVTLDWSPLCNQCETDEDCNDGVFCNGQETCGMEPPSKFDDISVCQPGTPVDCSSLADQCNDAVCDERNDTCEVTPKPDGTGCDDGLFCTVDDQCTGGVCGGDPRDCTGGNECLEGTCDEVNDECDTTPKTNGTLCEDDLYCTVDDNCQDGVCEGQARDCSDGVDCTEDLCDEGADACVNDPDDAFCDNGLYCDGAETCDPVDGCVPGTPPDCDDHVGCTADSCNEDADACENVPDHGFCDNGLFCDGAETCDPDDDCVPGTPVDCDDDLFCNGEETCDEDSDSCVAGTPPDCDDHVDCTVDSCDDYWGVCLNVADDGLCDNGIFCDGAETCNRLAGCRTGTPPECDDGQFCNGFEYCDPTPDECVAGTPPCDDLLFCNGAETCDEELDICYAAGEPPCDPADEYCDEDIDQCKPGQGEQEFVMGDDGTWLDTGVMITSDGLLEIVATGWLIDIGTMTMTGPDGSGDINCDAPECPLPGGPLGALIGRIGGAIAAGEPFLVGSDFSETTSQGGTLYLIANDSDHSDNSGMFSVGVGFDPDPTSIELVYFEAQGERGAVRLSWETASELDNAGFNLWRSGGVNGQFVRITPSLIPGRGNEYTGAEYEWIDQNVEPKSTYWYKLEDIDIHGRSTFYGPVDATVPADSLFGCGMAPGPGSPDLSLLLWLTVALFLAARKRKTN